MLQITAALRALATASSPFDSLAAGRLGLVSLCAMLRALPSGGPSLAKALAPAIASFLSRDFPALLVEEEEGIVPRLRTRLLLGDNLDEIIEELSDEHREDRAFAIDLARRCEAFADDLDDDWPELCAALTNFAERQRRHLAWEDATIFPIARERLTAEDLLSWRTDMDRRYQDVTICAPRVL